MSAQIKHNFTVANVLPKFVEYMSVELRFSPATIEKYQDNVRGFLRDVGDLPITEMGIEHFISIKARMAERGAKAARMASVICALKCLLAYARDILAVPVLDLSKVKVPRSSRKEVIYLTKEELEQFLDGIPLRTWMGKPRLTGYRFRALVETLAATAMRISEVLSLNRDTIDFGQKQAKVVGKGNKERTVFFTDRALKWIMRYLDLRTDKSPALFVTPTGIRLKPKAVAAMFKRHTQWLGITMPVTPHIIRHTAATTLLQNGCPIGFIKEILGHQRLETTCRFYLGILNKEDTQKAHQLYANFDAELPGDEQQTTPAHFGEGRTVTPSPLTDVSPQLPWRYQP